jgi:hypothetical protein
MTKNSLKMPANAVKSDRDATPAVLITELTTPAPFDDMVSAVESRNL